MMLMISIWIRVLMVRMHLDLTKGPFVPHNLTSVQPCSLLKFQMNPWLNFVRPLGPRKETQISIFFFSQKSQVPQQGPYGENSLFTRRFLHISQIPHKNFSVPTADNYRRNYFPCMILSSTTPYLRLFQWSTSAQYRLASRAAVRSSSLHIFSPSFFYAFTVWISGRIPRVPFAPSFSSICEKQLGQPQ